MVHSLSFLEPGALCGVWFHVAARGIDLKDIFLEDAHRRHWLELLEEWVHRFRLRLHTYARMSNHYHLLLETPQANLSQASSGCRPVTACGLTAKEGEWVYSRALTKPWWSMTIILHFSDN